MVKQTGPAEWAVSMRSKGAVDVSRVAVALGGGGHRLAAGFTGRGTVEQVVESIRGQLDAALVGSTLGLRLIVRRPGRSGSAPGSVGLPAFRDTGKNCGMEQPHDLTVEAPRAWDRPAVSVPVLVCLSLVGGRFASFSTEANLFTLGTGGVLIWLGLSNRVSQSAGAAPAGPGGGLVGGAGGGLRGLRGRRPSCWRPAMTSPPSPGWPILSWRIN